MPTTSTTTNKRLAQGARSRGEILDAAERMMAVRGFDGTSVADIARESGLPNSSIYWHFTSKAGILAAVMERGAERFFVAVENPPRREGESPRDYLGRAMHAAGAVLVEQPDFLRIFTLLTLSSEDEDAGEIVARVRAHGRASLVEMIGRAFAEVAPDRADAVGEATADFALAAFDGAFLALQFTPTGSHEQLMDQLAGALAALGGDALENLG